MDSEDYEALFDQFTADVDAYVRERFGYRTSCTLGRSPTVSVVRKKIQLYLRFKGGGDWPENVLVIASIRFQTQRAGHGRALLNKFAGDAERYGL